MCCLFFPKKYYKNLQLRGVWGLASAKKSNAERNKMVLNMFLSQTLFLNWFENQPPLQSKKKQVDKKPVLKVKPPTEELRYYVDSIKKNKRLRSRNSCFFFIFGSFHSAPDDSTTAVNFPLSSEFIMLKMYSFLVCKLSSVTITPRSRYI